jgi:hypothetical protein
VEEVISEISASKLIEVSEPTLFQEQVEEERERALSEDIEMHDDQCLLQFDEEAEENLEDDDVISP